MFALLVAAPAFADALPDLKRTTDAFVGPWNAEATITLPGEKPETFPMSLDCRVIANGNGTACTMNGTWSGGAMSATCLMAFDPVGSTGVHFMCVTSDGEVHDHRGRWTDAKHLVFDRLSWSGGPGGNGWEDLASTWPDSRTMIWTSSTGMADGSVLKFTLHATRR